MKESSENFLIRYHFLKVQLIIDCTLQIEYCGFKILIRCPEISHFFKDFKVLD